MFDFGALCKGNDYFGKLSNLNLMYLMLSEQQPYWNYVFLTICCMFMVVTQTFTTVKTLRIFVVYLSYNRVTSS